MKPSKLIETPQIKDNTTSLTETSYTAAETGYIAKYPLYTNLKTTAITSLGGIIHLIGNTRLENYAVAERTVYLSLWMFGLSIDWEKIGGDGIITFGAESAGNLIMDTYQSNDYWLANGGWANRSFAIMASCIEDNSSIKASYRRMTMTEHRGK